MQSFESPFFVLYLNRMLQYSFSTGKGFFEYTPTNNIMKPQMTPEKRQKILLALTQIHRNLKNGDTKVSWHKIFKDQGFKTSNEITEIRKALVNMKIIHINRKGEVSWSRERTLPNPLLIDGIYSTINATRKQKKAVVTPEVIIPEPIIAVVINGCPINPTIVSVGL